MTSELKPPSSSGFWEERSGWKRLKEVLLLEPLPGGARWAAAFGSLLLFSFVVQVVTGILMAMNYAPSEKTAWASVNFIQNEITINNFNLGGFIRGLHHWGSSAMVILLLVHMIQVFVWGAYKRPREFTWMVGVLLLFCTLGLAFTGYLLPWDQKAYWATKVGLGIAGTVPGIGDALRDLLQGGSQIGNLTLTRFYAIHGFILPGALIALVVVHLYLFRQHGVTPPWWKTPSQLKALEEPFWPGQAFKDAVLALLFLVGLSVWVYYRPAPLEAQADPSKAYEARPEWYFMFLFQLLRYFKGDYEVVGTFVLPTVFFLVLFFWPFLDRNPVQNPARRPIAIGLLTLGTASLIGLTIFAIQTDVRMTEPAQAVAKEPAPREQAGPIQALEIAKLYTTNCQACHGVDGSGKELRPAMPTLPDFTSFAWQINQTELEIAHRIIDGNEPKMPAFRDKLTKDQNLGLAIYVRAFALESRKPVASKPGVEPPKEPIKEPPSPVASHLEGEQLYRSYLCLSCHDLSGSGALVRTAMPEIPDFRAAKWHAEHASDAELAKSILEGKGKFMVPLKGKMATEDANRLVAFVRSFKEGKVVKAEPKEPPKPPPDKPLIEYGPETAPPKVIPSKDTRPAAQEKAARIRAASVLYREYCLTCHGKDGRGLDLKAAMPAIPDFTSRAWQESRTNPQLNVSILEGKGTLMPAFRGRVNEQQALDLAAYIRSFGPAQATPKEAESTDFEQSFRELEKQWNELQKQLDELPKPPRKP
ncbi:MAG TPA: cytochrome b N-terminal domain-containing protein [Gemmataceae bacterium]|nr:cytochrome b N-terminal domain-containing protein [Gemmataceae bacterium]